jgi:hypothetical protein
MNASLIRDLNFEQLKDRLSGLRQAVHSALQLFGPCTTRVLAHKAGLDILTVRPRVTELVELGFAECTGRNDGEGVYRALNYNEAARKFSDAQKIARGEGVQQSFL